MIELAIHSGALQKECQSVFMCVKVLLNLDLCERRWRGNAVREKFTGLMVQKLHYFR